jgi:hypothetical protein
MNRKIDIRVLNLSMLVWSWRISYNVLQIGAGRFRDLNQISKASDVRMKLQIKQAKQKL